MHGALMCHCDGLAQLGSTLITALTCYLVRAQLVLLAVAACSLRLRPHHLSATGVARPLLCCRSWDPSLLSTSPRRSITFARAWQSRTLTSTSNGTKSLARTADSGVFTRVCACAFMCMHGMHSLARVCVCFVVAVVPPGGGGGGGGLLGAPPPPPPPPPPHGLCPTPPSSS
jgi:hypothetical protein